MMGLAHPLSPCCLASPRPNSLAFQAPFYRQGPNCGASPLLSPTT